MSVKNQGPGNPESISIYLYPFYPFFYPAQRLGFLGVLIMYSSNYKTHLDVKTTPKKTIEVHWSAYLRSTCPQFSSRNSAAGTASDAKGVALAGPLPGSWKTISQALLQKVEAKPNVVIWCYVCIFLIIYVYLSIYVILSDSVCIWIYLKYSNIIY